MCGTNKMCLMHWFILNYLKKVFYFARKFTHFTSREYGYLFIKCCFKQVFEIQEKSPTVHTLRGIQDGMVYSVVLFMGYCLCVYVVCMFSIWMCVYFLLDDDTHLVCVLLSTKSHFSFQTDRAACRILVGDLGQNSTGIRWQEFTGWEKNYSISVRQKTLQDTTG